MIRDREKLDALAEGVAAWMAGHPISTHDALCDGAKQGVTRWLDDNAAEFIDRLAGLVAAKTEDGAAHGASPEADAPMTKSQKRRLVRAFAAAYELAYRRGFQHGYVVREENPKITGREIAEWRSSPVKERCSPPPGSGGQQPTPLSRMLFESREHGEVIREFLLAEPRLGTDD